MPESRVPESRVTDPSTVAVACGGNSPEHDVSILTGLQAARALVDAGGATGADVKLLYWSKAGDWYRVDLALEASAFVDGVPRGAEALRLMTGAGNGHSAGGFIVAGGRMARQRTLDIDVVVNCCHGGPGEDGTLQAALDLAGLAYTGPGVAAAALGMDKLAFGGVVTAAGLPALPRVALGFGGGAGANNIGFDGPYIVKPRYGGSSIGVEVVADESTARARLGANIHLRRGAVMEPYRPDLFDLNVAVRTWPAPEVSAIEKPLRSAPGAEILGYADKYVGAEGMASAPRELPAQIKPDLADAVRAQALAIVELAEVRGIARVDFLSDGDVLFVNEVNTIPGSLARYLWVDPPIGFDVLLNDMIEEARSRPTARYSAVGADGSVLRGAGSIAGKLN